MRKTVKGSVGVCQVAWAELFPFRRWWPRVNRATLQKDFFAGLTGAVIVLPQGVAFAAIAGLPPQYGLYTAMIPPIIAALFGSSYHLISGPTTAISIVVFSTLAPIAEPGSAPFISMAITLALMSGLIQLGMGLARLGALVNFVSHSVVVGFTAGAAILIASSQLKHFLGLTLPGGLSFLETILAVITHIPDIQIDVLMVGATALGTAVIFRIIAPKWPGMLFALVVGGLFAYTLEAKTGAKIPLVGALPPQLPPFSSAMWDAHTWQTLASSALAIALLGLIEAVSIARSVALHTRQRINGNQEFIGQGLSNIIGSFFSSYPASGSFTRSGVNYRAGAVTPMAAVFAAIPLMFIVVLIAPLAAYVPISAMAGVILLVAYNLIEFKHIRGIIRTSSGEALVMGVTFMATLLLHLELAIYVGVLLSLGIYLSKASSPQIKALVPSTTRSRRMISARPHEECPQFKIVQIDGALFFGAVNHVDDAFRCMESNYPKQKHVLLIGEGIHFIDVAGAEFLRHEAQRWKDKQGKLFLCDMGSQVSSMIERGGHLKVIGKEHLFPTKREAIQTIVGQHLDHDICKKCDRQVFTEDECSENPDERFFHRSSAT
ncbi:SulP family inorganic anion transporter [Magnetococcales bacterium HHB-1]